MRQAYMHDHHLHIDSWIHFVLAALWMSMPWWIEHLEAGGRLLTTFAPYIAAIIGGLQIAYLIRKHVHFRK